MATTNPTIQHLMGHKPPWAKALVVAELREDRSDPVTDYFNSTVVRTVALGWSKSTWDLFPELRKFAATFEETAHLATAGKVVEHREKWSMGKGFYLAADSYSGWHIKKKQYLDNLDPDMDYSRVLPPTRPGPAFTPADTAVAPFAHVDPPAVDSNAAISTLKALLASVKPSFYSTATYAAAATDEDAMGILLARFFDHDGAAILRTAESALEDANFHAESALVADMAAKVEAL